MDGGQCSQRRSNKEDARKGSIGITSVKLNSSLGSKETQIGNVPKDRKPDDQTATFKFISFNDSAFPSKRQ